jgi:hypothetical protein
MGPDSMLRWFAQNRILLNWSYLGLRTCVVWVLKLSIVLLRSSNFYLYAPIWYATSLVVLSASIFYL